MTKQQDFVWAPDLKNDLARINIELSAKSELERQEGLHKIAPYPPGDSNSLVVSLWQKHAPGASKTTEVKVPLDPEAEKRLVKHLKSFSEAPTASDVADLSTDELESVSIPRLVPARKGNWWLIPKSVADKEGREEA